MNAQSLIPTRHKGKLPRGLSYSFSAGEISNLLASLELYLSCRLCFSDRGTYWHSEWQKALRERGEIVVLSCTRNPWADEWDIHIYSVPSKQRQVLRAALRTTAIPRLLQWFAGKRGARFSAHFHLDTQTIRVETYPQEGS